ncbi:MAG: hypothetical protein LBK42_09530 [Propionibacteriaceae bacterium]|jgi:hypothetical protein|nr:hypothetical protein [Propionibacteriaceae bacterium]
MNVLEILHDKGKKAVEKRAALVAAIKGKELSIDDLSTLSGLIDKDLGIILEAMEEVSRSEPALSDAAWLALAEKYIDSDNNTLKREASRVIGNIAHLFAEQLDSVVSKLLANSRDEGTVVRWGSGYALGRIILIPQYANSDLYGQITAIAEAERENGVKNQYSTGLKKAKKLRG